MSPGEEIRRAGCSLPAGDTPGGTSALGPQHWDQHDTLFGRLAENCLQVDKPIAGLLTDLKQRDLLEDTVVLWGGEFGRTPVSENYQKNAKEIGRDHNPEGFTMWMAGGGVKGGIKLRRHGRARLLRRRG